MKKVESFFFAVVFLLLIIGCSKNVSDKQTIHTQGNKNTETDLNLVSTKLATLQEDIDFSEVFFSPNGRQVGY